MFAELKDKGKATLYFYAGDRSGNSKFIFKRQNESFFVFDMATQLPKSVGLDINAPGMPVLLESEGAAFINFFEQYFKDCPIVVRKIKQEFYTSAEIVEMFKEYNKVCGKQ
jgi:hypothetical protein